MENKKNTKKRITTAGEIIVDECVVSDGSSDGSNDSLGRRSSLDGSNDSLGSSSSDGSNDGLGRRRSSSETRLDFLRQCHKKTINYIDLSRMITENETLNLQGSLSEKNRI